MITSQAIHEAIQAALDKQDPNREGWAAPAEAKKIADRTCELLEVDERHCPKCGVAFEMHEGDGACPSGPLLEPLSPLEVSNAFWRAAVESELAEDLTHVETTLLESLDFKVPACLNISVMPGRDIEYIRFTHATARHGLGEEDLLLCTNAGWVRGPDHALLRPNRPIVIWAKPRLRGVMVTLECGQEGQGKPFTVPFNSILISDRNMFCTRSDAQELWLQLDEDGWWRDHAIPNELWSGIIIYPKE